MQNLIKKYDLSEEIQKDTMTRDQLYKLISEQLGGSFSTSQEEQLEISIELCRAYCKMMADAFDKASRGSSKTESVHLQIQVVDKYIESLNKEIKNLQKINQDLSRRQ